MRECNLNQISESFPKTSPNYNNQLFLSRVLNLQCLWCNTLSILQQSDFPHKYFYLTTIIKRMRKLLILQLLQSSFFNINYDNEWILFIFLSIAICYIRLIILSPLTSLLKEFLFFLSCRHTWSFSSCIHIFLPLTFW